MNNIHGIIIGYGSPIEMRELTDHRTASSLPFASRYRVIDFMLSTMTAAGVTDIGVIMEENYQSLLDHLGTGRDWDLARKLGGLKLLPPFALNEKRKKGDSYRGWMEAFASIKSYIERVRQDYIVIADGNIVSSFDLNAVFDSHLKTGADVTAVCTSDASSLGSDVYFRFSESGFVSEVLLGVCEEGATAALGVYIISKALLLECIEYCSERSLYSFSRDVLQRMCRGMKIGNYVIHGYASRLDTAGIYYCQSMKLLESRVRADLFPPERPVKTKVRDDAPTYYSPDSNVGNSIVADGCFIEGEVTGSIIFRGVRIAPGAVVKNCVLMQDTFVGKGAKLVCAITDKSVHISSGKMLIGEENYPIVIAKGSRV